MPALQPYVDGNVVPASQLTQRDPIQAIKPADQTVNNSTTLVNDSALFVPVAANATYRFELNLRYNTNSTANIKWAWTFPAGLTMKFLNIVRAPGAGSIDIFQSDQTQVNSAGGVSFGLVSIGTVTVSSTAGTLQLQWAQNTANASNTLVQAGSYVLLNQIA